MDAYACIREIAALRDEDTSAKCLVCSLERFVCDKKCGGFETHVETDHNPLVYLFWMYYLHHKPREEQNGECRLDEHN